ncbi:LOW QUALITY PROTEIN: T-complex protein 11 homolog [Glossophaga mutica]
MQDVEDNVPLEDPGAAESGSCKPKTPGLVDTGDDTPKLGNEVGMNHDFHKEEVLPPRRSSLGGKVKETMHNAFWDRLKEQLSATPPDYSCALELLKEIKEILPLLLLPRQNRLGSEIEEALSTDLLQREAEHGALNVPHLSKYILNTRTLCAPVRDEAVHGLDDITDSAGLLRCEA